MSTSMKAKGSFEPGSLVFAKMKGYPHWPARVEHASSSTPKKKKKIFFFGTHETAHLPESSLFDFNQNKELYGKPKTYKGFIEGMYEIIMYPDVKEDDLLAKGAIVNELREVGCHDEAAKVYADALLRKANPPGSASSKSKKRKLEEPTDGKPAKAPKLSSSTPKPVSRKSITVQGVTDSPVNKTTRRSSRRVVKEADSSQSESEQIPLSSLVAKQTTKKSDKGAAAALNVAPEADYNSDEDAGSPEMQTGAINTEMTKSSVVSDATSIEDVELKGTEQSESVSIRTNSEAIVETDKMDTTEDSTLIKQNGSCFESTGQTTTGLVPVEKEFTKISEEKGVLTETKTEGQEDEVCDGEKCPEERDENANIDMEEAKPMQETPFIKQNAGELFVTEDSDDERKLPDNYDEPESLNTTPLLAFLNVDTDNGTSAHIPLSKASPAAKSTVRRSTSSVASSHSQDDAMLVKKNGDKKSGRNSGSPPERRRSVSKERKQQQELGASGKSKPMDKPPLRHDSDRPHPGKERDVPYEVFAPRLEQFKIRKHMAVIESGIKRALAAKKEQGMDIPMAVRFLKEASTIAFTREALLAVPTFVDTIRKCQRLVGSEEIRTLSTNLFKKLQPIGVEGKFENDRAFLEVFLRNSYSWFKANPDEPMSPLFEMQKHSPVIKTGDEMRMELPNDPVSDQVLPDVTSRPEQENPYEEKSETDEQVVEPSISPENVSQAEDMTRSAITKKKVPEIKHSLLAARKVKASLNPHVPQEVGTMRKDIVDTEDLDENGD